MLMSSDHRAFATNAAQRQRFRRWIRLNRCKARRLPLPILLTWYGRAISFPSAYRIAVAEGVRGGRFNRTKFDAFRNTINWDLPDGVLHAIWCVLRGNLRQRRVRIGAGSPKYTYPDALFDPQFTKAVFREKQVARRYEGLRPH
jgi:hypothetical protein